MERQVLTTIYRPDGKVSMLAGPLANPILVMEGRPAVHPPRQVMTLNRLHALIAAGYGQGFGESYLAWMRIRRRLTSRVSNLVVLANPLYATRHLNMLSRLEGTGSTIAMWLGARELRDQFPLWPDDHNHPDWGSPNQLEGTPQFVPGLMSIAREAGIKHGTFPGTQIPYVASADLLVQPPADRLASLTLIPVKPQSEIEKPGRKGMRVLERLELQRRYANAVGARYVEFTDCTCTPLLGSQLNWFMPLHSELKALRDSNELHIFAERFNALCGDLPISACTRTVRQAMGIKRVGFSHLLFRVAAWTGLINLDFRKPILMRSLIRLDPNGYKASLADHFFGQRKLK